MIHDFGLMNGSPPGQPLINPRSSNLKYGDPRWICTINLLNQSQMLHWLSYGAGRLMIYDFGLMNEFLANPLSILDQQCEVADTRGLAPHAIRIARSVFETVPVRWPGLVSMRLKLDDCGLANESQKQLPIINPPSSHQK